MYQFTFAFKIASKADDKIYVCKIKKIYIFRPS